MKIKNKITVTSVQIIIVFLRNKIKSLNITKIN